MPLGRSAVDETMVTRLGEPTRPDQKTFRLHRRHIDGGFMDVARAPRASRELRERRMFVARRGKAPLDRRARVMTGVIE